MNQMTVENDRPRIFFDWNKRIDRDMALMLHDFARGRRGGDGVSGSSKCVLGTT